MIRLDLMPIPILNKYKSEKGTHTQRDLKEHPHKSYNQPYHSKYKINVNEDKEGEIEVVTKHK